MKDRDNFTKEELLSENEFLLKKVAELELRLKTNYNRGLEDGKEQFMDRVRPLYLKCFTSKGWIGYNNLNTSSVGGDLLGLLSFFHNKIK